MGPRDPMIEKYTAWLQPGADRTKILPQIPETDMLKHTYARNLVECIGRAIQLAVIAKSHIASISEPGNVDSPTSFLVLLAAQGNP